MDPGKWKQVKALFAEMIELPVDARDRLYIGHDAEIQNEVRRLISAHFEAFDFIAEPYFANEAGGFESRDDLEGKQIGVYRIINRVGVGGMGTVYLADREDDGVVQRVALKVIKRGMDSDAILRRFANERRILSGLEHPYIARLLDWGISSNGLSYFVMEYIDGKQLGEHCRGNDLTLASRLEIFIKICSAVEYAHQSLIVHRDLKPANVLIARDGSPKLLDFGIAKVLADDEMPLLTKTHINIFTPEYASPEQILGGTVTTVTDVYSLGVILYELLTSSRPFDVKGKSLEEIVRTICETDPPLPSDTRGQYGDTGEIERRTTGIAKNLLRGDIDNIILKALRKEPSERYRSVRDLSDDISRYLSGRPVLARPQTYKYRVGKYVRRHAVGVAAVFVIAISLISGISIATWQAINAKRQKEVAENRYKELRSVAKSLLTDTNAALVQLPGGLDARRGVVAKSVALLESLAAGDTDDVSLLADIAQANEELGRLQGLHFRERDDGLASFKRALDLRRRIVGLQPTVVEHRVKLAGTLQNFVDTYLARGERQKALETLIEAGENNVKALEIAPADTDLVYSAGINKIQIAEILIELGRTDEAGEYKNKSFELVQSAIDIHLRKDFSYSRQTILVGYLMQKGEMLAASQRTDEALAIYLEAARIAEETYRADKTQTFACNHTGRLHRLIGDIHRDRGEWKQALDNYDFSIRWIDENQNNPGINSRNFRFGKASFMVWSGNALYKLGQKREGEETVERAVRLYREYRNEYAKDALELFGAESFVRTAAPFYADIGRDDKCLAIWQEYSRLAESFLREQPENTTVQVVFARSIEGEGDVLSKYRPDADTFAETRHARLSQASERYRRSLEMLQGLGEKPDGEMATVDISRLAQKISKLNDPAMR